MEKIHTHRQTQSTQTHTGTEKRNPSAKRVVTAGKLAGQKVKAEHKVAGKNGFIELLSRWTTYTHTYANTRQARGLKVSIRPIA